MKAYFISVSGGAGTAQPRPTWLCCLPACAPASLKPIEEGRDFQGWGSAALAVSPVPAGVSELIVVSPQTRDGVRGCPVGPHLGLA